MRRAVLIALAVTALLVGAALAEVRGNVSHPAVDLATGCVLLLSGLVAIRHESTRPSGVALLAAGGTWFVATAGVGGPLLDPLAYAHRWLLVAAVLLTPGSVPRRWRYAVILLAMVGSLAAAQALSPTWLLVIAAATVGTLVADAWRNPTLARYATVAGGGVVLWTVAVAARNLGGADASRFTAYGVGVSLAAVAVAGWERLVGSFASMMATDLVRDAGSGDVHVGFRTRAGEPYRDSDGTFLGVPDGAAVELTFPDGGGAVVIHPAVRSLSRQARRELDDAVLLLYQHVVALDASRRQADEIAESERRLRAADEIAGLELASEIDRSVVAPLERAVASLGDAGSPAALAQRERLVAVVAELLRIVHGLAPSDLAGGLGDALTSLVARAGLPARVSVEPVPLDPDSALVVYFVAAEAVTNALRHAQATQIEVHVTDEHGWVELVVADDGVGGARPALHGGLHGLQHRVAGLGGTLHVAGGDGGGTVVSARLPSRVLSGPV